MDKKVIDKKAMNIWYLRNKRLTAKIRPLGDV